MKGICHTWSRGRHFSPSLPGDRYLKLGSKSDHRAEISGNIVRYDALAPRPEVQRSFSSIYANNVFKVFFFAQAQNSENYFVRPLRNIENWQFSHLFKRSFSRIFGVFVFAAVVVVVWSPFSMKNKTRMVLEFKNTHVAKNRVVFRMLVAFWSSAPKYSIFWPFF